MTPQDLERLYAYHRWANDRTLTAARKLTVEQFHRDLSSSFPSVRDTLVHMVSADWVWLQRWYGHSPNGWAEASALQTVMDIRAKWEEIEDGQAAFIASLDDAALERPLSYTNMAGEPLELPLGAVMQHVVNHGSYHRGQVTTMLRQLGARIEATDLVAFVDQESLAR